MDNQHQKIKGYRDLSQAEIDLMNKIKTHEAATLALVREVRAHIGTQVIAADALYSSGDTNEFDRISNADPHRWGSIAATDLQTGYMALVRAVAQPVTP